MLGQNAAQRQVTLFKSILELHLNNPLERLDSNRAIFFDVYLKHMLAQAYPKDFSMGGTLFELHLKGPLCKGNKKYQMVLDALGIVDVKGIVFNPDQFNPNKLDDLYKLDKNPLWLVLKSTMPIGPNFTDAQKISAYIDLAQAFFHKKLGATEKYLGAYDMAKAAYAIETTDPSIIQRRDAAFQPLRSEKHYKKLGEEGHFGNWIVMKHQEHAKLEDKLLIIGQMLGKLSSFSSQSSSLSSESHSPSSTPSADERSLSTGVRSLLSESRLESKTSSKLQPSGIGLFSRSRVSPEPSAQPESKKEDGLDTFLKQ